MHDNGSTACTDHIQEAQKQEKKAGASCRVQVEHLLFQNSGRIGTLWSLICDGNNKVADKISSESVLVYEPK